MSSARLAAQAAKEALALALGLWSRWNELRNRDTVLCNADRLSGLSHTLDHRKAGCLELRDLDGNHKS